MAVHSSAKFRVKAELALFEAIQREGRLSEEAIARQTRIPPTTVHYALARIRQRDFFDIKAVPRLPMFPEVPMGFIGFEHVHPLKLRELRKRTAHRPEIRQLVHSERDVLLGVMGTSQEALTQTLFELMELLGEKPSLYLTCPKVAKWDVTIPDKVLETVYTDLPDRRIHT